MQHLSHLLEELKTVRAEHKDGEDQQDKVKTSLDSDKVYYRYYVDDAWFHVG